jgi:putative transposase
MSTSSVNKKEPSVPAALKVRGSRISRRTLSDAEKNYTLWPQVDKSLITPEANAELFERRRQAVALYLDSTPLKGIEQLHGLNKSEIHRLVKRALKLHPDGRIWGFRAFIPGIHIRPYIRISEKRSKKSRTSGFSGLLSRLFAQHPEIQDEIIKEVLKQGRGPNISRLSLDYIFEIFIKNCRKAEIAQTEYPFTTKWLGYYALHNYIKNIKKNNLSAFVSAQCGQEAANSFKTGTEFRTPVTRLVPLQSVGFDGHRFDALFMVRIPHRMGGFIEVIINRPWLLIIIDLVSRAILGWHLSLNPEYTKDDVLECVRKAVQVSEPPVLTIPNLKFDPEGGMPNWVIPEMRWAVWSEMIYDNGKANLSEWVRSQIKLTLGCAIHSGPTYTPEHNAITESVFRIIESKVGHVLPSTTGSNPKDPRRNNPEEAARKYNIQFDHLTEIMHVAIAKYNGDPKRALGYRSPLLQLRHWIDEGEARINRIPTEKRQSLNLLSMKKSVTVRGNIKKGRRLYIQLLDERYSSDTLAHLPELKNTEIHIIINTEDLRTVQAFLPNGAELCTLVALGGWRCTKHSLITRKITNALAHKKILKIANSDDPVMVFLDYLRDKAPQNRKAASRYAKVYAEAGAPDCHTPETSTNTEVVKDSDEKTTKVADTPEEEVIAPPKRERRTIIY